MVILLVAMVFVVGLAYLTLHTIVEQKGISVGTAVSVFIVVLMGVGIFGALAASRRCLIPRHARDRR